MNSAARREPIDSLKARVDLVDMIRSYGVELVQDGKELRGLCPFHNEKTPSFTVDPEKQCFKCFGCDADGAHVQFLQRWHKTDVGGAVRELERIAGGGTVLAPSPEKTASTKRRAQWIPVPVADREPADRDFRHYKLGQPVARWAYRGAAGELLGYVCRFEFAKEGGGIGKDVLPLVWAANQETGECAWRWLSFEKPRPMYGLDRLASRPNAQVLIVEGEKTADAAQRLVPGVVVVSWPGGGKAVRFVDWSPLQGRKVMIWPDRDAPGYATAEGWIDKVRNVQPGIAQLLQGVAAVVKVVEPPAGEPDGWDLADAEAEGWDGARVGAHIRTNVRDPRVPAVVDESEAPPPANDNEPHDEVPPDLGDYDGGEPYAPDDDEPFRCLGYGPGPVYFYMPEGTNLVTELTPGGHGDRNLLSLAPMSFWERRYAMSGEMKKGNWIMAANSMMQRSHAIGLFDPDLVRGRGAWWDDGKPAIHLGDAVVINEERYALGGAPSRYVYQRGKPLQVSMEEPLTNGEAVELVRICEMLSWEKPVNAQLLAGWCVLAPICGALRWRPHIWVTGSSGSGKSTVMSLIVHRAMGQMALFVQSATTEAGLRQALGSDALPVVFDEAESEDEKAEQRINSIMSLVTQASSETGARIVKGSATGQAMMYNIRSMFAFSSIAINLRLFAAKTRVTVLGLVRQPATPTAMAHYQDILRRINDVMTETFVQRLHARSIRLIPVIRKNAETFTAAAAIVLGSQRLGDQVGALLAGAFALYSTREITRDEAEAWIRKQDWSEVASVSEMADEQGCLAHIMQSLVEVELNHGRVRRAVGELMACAGAVTEAGDVPVVDAKAALRRYGLKVEGGLLLVANQHKALTALLDGTPWVNSWSRTLLRLPGAEKHDPAWFAGVKQRCVSIPLSSIFGP